MEKTWEYKMDQMQSAKKQSKYVFMPICELRKFQIIPLLFRLYNTLKMASAMWSWKFSRFW